MSIALRIQMGLFLTGLIMGALVVFFGGWLLDCHPISELPNHHLSNVPAPASARYFSISHGEAVYYADSPADNPLKAAAIIASFGIAWLTFFACVLLLVRHRKQTTNAPRNSMS